MSEDAYDRIPTEELEAAISHLHDLKRHPGYVLLQTELAAQQRTLVGLLIDADEGNVRIAQGGLRQLRDILEGDDPTKPSKRQQLIDAFTEIVTERAEERRIREEAKKRKSDI